MPPPSGEPYRVHPTGPAPLGTEQRTQPIDTAGQRGREGAGAAYPYAGSAAAASWYPSPNRAAIGARSWLGLAALLAGALAIALVSALMGGVAGAYFVGRSSASGGNGSPLPAPAPGSTLRPAGSIASIAARALPSVVTIKVKASDGAGTGSGFAIRSDGYILTNNHVVSVAGSSGTITVEWSNGTSLPATVVGRDASYDLAVIRVRRSGLPTLALASSATAVVGDEVVAVGAPLGLESSVTSGIISALNRPVTTGDSQSAPAFINAIQTDAAINPGNSGGPLLNMSGDVIGINSAIARVPGSDPLGTTQSGNIGVGFSIPSDQARRTAQQLIATGKASHPVIGVLLDSAYTGKGVRVAIKGRNSAPPITPHGPADNAGLQAGDILLTLDGQPITDSDQFIVAVRAHAVGDRIRLNVRRGSKEQTVTMTLQEVTD
jgi:putative serine protease PepD